MRMDMAHHSSKAMLTVHYNRLKGELAFLRMALSARALFSLRRAYRLNCSTMHVRPRITCAMPLS